MRAIVSCPTIVISNGSQFSSPVRADLIQEDSDDILLLTIAIDALRTFSIQICDRLDGDGNWRTYNDGTADISPPAAGKAGVYPFLNYTFRIAADANVASTCSWSMLKSFSYSR